MTWSEWINVWAWAVQNGYDDIALGQRGSHGDSRNTNNHPVTMVNWFDVVKWLNAVSEKEGLTPCYTLGNDVYRTGEPGDVVFNPHANGYRLPTESEWEYAARAGTSTAFYAGEITYPDSGAPLDLVLDAVGWYAANSNSQSQAVGLKLPNNWDLYDMHGNVYEWCWDWSGSYTTETVDPLGPETGSFRGLRSGAWSSRAAICRAARKSSDTPALTKTNTFGFRPVRTINYSELVIGELEGFDPTFTGAQAEQSLSLKNNGTQAVNVSDVTLPDGFSLVGLPVTIEPGETINVTIEFAPGQAGAFGGELAFDSNASWGAFSIALTGTGVIPTRIISLAGGVDFGEVPTGATSVRKLELTNIGNATLTVSGIDVPEGFSVEWAGTIAPSASQVVSISFAPQAEQTYSGTLTIQSNATEGVNEVAVSGVGVPEFSLIPAGTFTMGRTSGDTDAEAPPVSVNVNDFYMARYEVTLSLWNGVRNWAVNNGYTDIATGAGKGAMHPVHTVNWWDVVKWCNARSEREGLTPVYRNANGTVFKTGTTAPTANWNADGYRLPTEAEWEKAARGGVSGQRFPWGDTITHSQANYNSDSFLSWDISPTRGYHPNYIEGDTPYTSPEGSFVANGYGLYDMAGNVFEWCWDWYSDTAYMDGVTDPKGVSSGTLRVSRGGSWISSAKRSRSAERYSITPEYRNINRGFRLVRISAP